MESFRRSGVGEEDIGERGQNAKVCSAFKFNIFDAPQHQVFHAT